ncbi:hypothetical protein Adi01nite_11000 [Amorphoplanes digitatis]|uniref:Allophanate hydrolase subunit 1 n=1 Tax=Actinoplanes digitatis TaxID=1868 RepID=A0A7W7MQ45_9ACTN|nr:allophanate hydrolase subunit 1 [Actinoplanes digitatis]BFE71743.1 hypothetical protein GCM10020092_050440 [Actinoplanes digitatis]GID91688.1 hypothetical protein Adi01nite_11000 [Actinoplanes digitatis]
MGPRYTPPRTVRAHPPASSGGGCASAQLTPTAVLAVHTGQGWRMLGRGGVAMFAPMKKLGCGGWL